MRRHVLILTLAAASLAVPAAVAIATSSSPTLKVKKGVHVTNAPNAAYAATPVNKREAIAVGPAGYAVYTFQGETTHHLICMKTNNQNTNCWGFWPPVSVKSARGLTKQAGIHGRLGTFRNHGTLQLTLKGQPLYYFTPDLMSRNKSKATGDELKTFGSIWHVVVARGGAGAQAPAPNAGGGAGPAWPY